MKKSIKIHPFDNVVVALSNLEKGEVLELEDTAVQIKEFIPVKHKVALFDLKAGEEIVMYGVLVGRASESISAGCVITTKNVKHATSAINNMTKKRLWNAPLVDNWKDRTFLGYHRKDGSVGTANYWIVVPMVFCENRNIDVLRESLVHDLGYGNSNKYTLKVQKLIELYKYGASVEEILQVRLQSEMEERQSNRIFKNVDGVKFLNHSGGCGGTRQDAQALCGLLAGYITHPNVAGATVLSLGCQNAQVKVLEEEIAKRSTDFGKPLYILEQQKIGTEAALLEEAIKKTFAGLVEANKIERKPASISKLCLGLECGGSDGFSGISANPAIGFASDLIVASGGAVILSEFPELCGVEQELVERCTNPEIASRFTSLMNAYENSATAVGSGFDMNPSPGNIRDGLITDAMKSAGAAKKGGTSPIVDVLDYPEKVSKRGLNLLCTPGNDVESTTAEVGAGANVVLFTTGLGTPTGNPIAPVVKISSNSALFQKMSDIIDIDTGTIIEGKETIEEAGERILDYVIKVASGDIEVSAVKHGQDDFIPWKRGVSL